MHPIRATGPTYLIPVDLTTRIICGEDYESRSITNATVTSNRGNTMLSVIVAFTHTYNKFLPVGFPKWNFPFCLSFPSFVSTGCNRVRCFICMQVADTAPVTCCLHGYWPPVLNRIGTNKSLSWHCRLPATLLYTLPVPWLTWILSNHAVVQTTKLVSCQIFQHGFLFSFPS